jgi:hypothetical protein
MGDKLTKREGVGRGGSQESTSIDSYKINILVEEVLIQCFLAMEHFAAATALLADPGSRQSRFVWAHVHAFLAQTAMVSKMVTAPHDASAIRKARCQVLKSTLNIASDLVILDRTARNNVEHFDQRLDLWIEDKSGRLIEMVFSNRSDFDFLFRDRPDGKATFIRRVLILDEMILITQGQNGFEEANLEILSKEIEGVRERAVEFLDSDRSVYRIYPGQNPDYVSGSD